ncbi:sigma-54-dependent transcriptional regulator [Saccharicrinis sp. FJH54]|uniref:sigma-54-dependent transcriptional regulator n=1 Tax=Saccharicrinis sp. FJH54 TaxID=3344665 RepID=UPI0035D47A4F
MKNPILVIDDDTYISDLLVRYLNQKGYAATGTYSGDQGKKLILENMYDVILCDYRLPDTNGEDMLAFVKQKRPGIPVIIMTAYQEIKTAVKLIKAGAYDYVTKPVLPDQILQLVSNACATVQHDPSLEFSSGFITGPSKKIQKVLSYCEIVAPTDVMVILQGETGAGKEYIARAIHDQSERKDKPFVAVDCGALPKELANSELFGHVKGSFTGAINDKKGYFEQAKGGTLFLDEVGNLTYENQVKLLRALQEKVIYRVGGNKPIKTDVRIITATNEDLSEMVKRNEFREDLYHRLNGFKIKIPPLRKRKEDIPDFVNYFIQKANKSFNKSVKQLSDEVHDIFMNYKWDGNIRELRNVINRSVLLTQGDEISKDVLPEEFTGKLDNDGVYLNSGLINENGIPDLREVTSLTEKELILNALNEAKYNKSKAAKMLNIDRKTLYNKLKTYNIDIARQ